MSSKQPHGDIPPERERQFDLIETATEKTLRWARESSVPLEYVYPVVPFVETDFGLEAWLFLDTEDRIREYRENGTDRRIADRFVAELASSGYPAEWLEVVECRFASKEVVDRDHGGSYYRFLR